MATNICKFRFLLIILLIYNVNILECLIVTCHNRVGTLFQRMNTCYIKGFDRSLEENEVLVFLQSYSSPEDIKTLDISTDPDNPGINHIPTEAFHWFTNLKSLRVNSKVDTIFLSDFQLATNLTELVISDQLKTIQRGIFPVTNKLTFLSFESNRISTIEDYAFETLTRLFSLKLQKNQLETIKRHTFTGLNGLFVLNLNQNKIRVIESGSFEGLAQLQFLHLQQNQIETLYDDIFHGLRSLIDISLGSNKINRINESLKYLTNIKKINLNYNQISDLDLKDFAKFSFLVDLRLINSGFSFEKTIQTKNESNSSASILEYLYLDNNSLSNPLDLQALRIFPELKELSLDENLYQNFDVGANLTKEILPKLQFISLDGNGIDENILKAINDEVNTQPTTINSM